jgi:hypothetical protein
MDELRAWVQASMLWNASRDPAALVAEFVASYYGAIAAPHVLAHISGWETSIRTDVHNWTTALAHGGFTDCGADVMIHPGNCYEQPWLMVDPVVNSAIALKQALVVLGPTQPVLSKRARCTVFDRNLHSRMPLSFTAFSPLETHPCV